MKRAPRDTECPRCGGSGHVLVWILGGYERVLRCEGAVHASSGAAVARERGTTGAPPAKASAVKRRRERVS